MVLFSDIPYVLFTLDISYGLFFPHIPYDVDSGISPDNVVFFLIFLTMLLRVFPGQGCFFLISRTMLLWVFPGQGCFFLISLTMLLWGFPINRAVF